MTKFVPPTAAMPARRGLMFVLSSPSGAGKTTMSRRLIADDPEIVMSISVTTRPPRPGEMDGRDYRFVSEPTFDLMQLTGDFLEWAEVFGYKYGTPRGPVQDALHAGQDVLFDIDWQGTQQLQQADSARDLVRVFILPPNISELDRRLRTRGTDKADVIDSRMQRARHEIEHWDAYDYVLVNDDADTCFHEIRAILRAERLRARRQLGLAAFVRDMLAT